MSSFTYLYLTIMIAGLISFIGGIRLLFKKDTDKPAMMYIVLGLGAIMLGFLKLTGN